MEYEQWKYRLIYVFQELGWYSALVAWSIALLQDPVILGEQSIS